MTGIIRAKFKCVSTTSRPAEPSLRLTEKTEFVHDVYFDAVTNNSPENAEFWKWTPSGRIIFSSLKGSAGLRFVPGKSYYVDFIEAPTQ